MLAMNYGCGSTVHPRDLADNPSVLYVGVGGGMELLQFAYFARRPGAVTGIDVVDEMLAACRENLREELTKHDAEIPRTDCYWGASIGAKFGRCAGTM